MNTEEWRAYVLEYYGGWRQYGLARVTVNWRIRKRLPALTRKAKELGMIKEFNCPQIAADLFDECGNFTLKNYDPYRRPDAE